MRCVEWPKCVYRYFDAAGTLLYVGKAIDPTERWNQHVRDQAEWVPRAHRRVDEWFLSGEEADEAERRIIADEDPLHNRVRYRRSQNHVSIPGGTGLMNHRRFGPD